MLSNTTNNNNNSPFGRGETFEEEGGFPNQIEVVLPTSSKIDSTQNKRGVSRNPNKTNELSSYIHKLSDMLVSHKHHVRVQYNPNLAITNKPLPIHYPMLAFNS